MKSRFSIIGLSLFSLFLSLVAISCRALTEADWQAGRVLTPSAVSASNLDSFFRADTISDQVFKRIWLKSYKRDCTVPRQELRYLRVLHVNKDGKPQTGEIICNRAIADDLLQIFRQLYLSGYRIEKMLLVDEYNADDETSMADNNTSCFNYRCIAGSKKLSYHSRGLAIDINPLINPCLHPRSGLVEPKAGKQYAHNRRNRKGQAIRFIDEQDLCYRLFIQHGVIWGGSWSTPKDYQHFEKRLP